MTQYSLFGAEAEQPRPADLDGLLLAGGQWVRSAGRARLSIVVEQRWRADALALAFAELGLRDDDAVVTSTGGFGVRTAFDEDLAAHARRWTKGSRTGLPAGFELSAGGLRLWTIASGHRDDVGYLLGTVAVEDPIHRAAGGQLARLGVAAVALAGRGGPGWRVTSAKRMRRLAELVGPEPLDADGNWPSTGHPLPR